MGYLLQFCPREGLPFPVCLLAYFLSLFPFSFTLVKLARIFGYLPALRLPTNTNQHRFNPPKYTTKAGTKKIFFHLNH